MSMQFGVNADKQMGQRLIIKNPEDNGMLYNSLQWALKKEIRSNGDICAWYESSNNYLSITAKDEVECQERIYPRKFTYKIETGFYLIDEVENWEEIYDKICEQHICSIKQAE